MGGVACLHAKTPQGHFGLPCFVSFIVIYNLCISPLLVLYHTLLWEPRPVSYASLAVGHSAKCTGQGTNTYDLCARSMWLGHLTTLQNLCIGFILVVPLGCNSHRLELAARDWLHVTTIKLLSNLRSWTFDHQFIPQPPTHHSARVWDATMRLTEGHDPPIQQLWGFWSGGKADGASNSTIHSIHRWI